MGLWTSGSGSGGRARSEPLSPDYFGSLLPKIPRQWGEPMAGLISWVQGMCCGLHRWGYSLARVAFS